MDELTDEKVLQTLYSLSEAADACRGPEDEVLAPKFAEEAKEVKTALSADQYSDYLCQVFDAIFNTDLVVKDLPDSNVMMRDLDEADVKLLVGHVIDQAHDNMEKYAQEFLETGDEDKFQYIFYDQVHMADAMIPATGFAKLLHAFEDWQQEPVFAEVTKGNPDFLKEQVDKLGPGAKTLFYHKTADVLQLKLDDVVAWATYSNNKDAHPNFCNGCFHRDMASLIGQAKVELSADELKTFAGKACDVLLSKGKEAGPWGDPEKLMAAFPVDLRESVEKHLAGQEHREEKGSVLQSLQKKTKQIAADETHKDVHHKKTEVSL